MEHKCPSCGHKWGDPDRFQQRIKEATRVRTSQFIAQYRALAATGANLDEIASEMGLRKETLRRRLRYNGITDYPRKHERSTPPSTFPAQFIEYREMGLTYSEIAERMGTARRNVLEKSRKYGLRDKGQSGRKVND